MEFLIWGNRISIDAIDSWSGKMNHKWLWPFYEDNLEIPDDWKIYFANVNVAEEGEIYALREINIYEELFIDYGEQFWDEIKPVWDFKGFAYDVVEFNGNEEISFIEALEEYEELTKLKNLSTIIND